MKTRNIIQILAGNNPHSGEFDAARFAQLQPNGGGTPEQITRSTPNFAFRRVGALAVASSLTFLGLGIQQAASLPSEACVETPGATTVFENEQKTAELLRQRGINVHDLGQLDQAVVNAKPETPVCLVDTNGILANVLGFVFPNNATNAPKLSR